MRLVYTATQKPVEIGDSVTLGRDKLEVAYLVKPHRPDTSGKVGLRVAGETGPAATELYVGSIGAEWIEREDREDGSCFAASGGIRDYINGKRQLSVADREVAQKVASAARKAMERKGILPTAGDAAAAAFDAAVVAYVKASREDNDAAIQRYQRECHD